MPVAVFGRNRIQNGDSTNKVDVAELMADAKAQLVVSSPPYAQQRNYTRKVNDWSALMLGVCKTIAPYLDADAQLLFVLGPVHQDGELVEYWRPWLDDMRGRGWKFTGQYVWDKLEAVPGSTSGRLAMCHEYIFHLCRSARPVNKTVPCIRAGEINHSGGTRTVDGTRKGWTGVGLPIQDYRVADSVLRMRPHKSGGSATDHPAVYPLALPKFLIEVFSQPDDIVLDPFLGSGTTALAAELTGRIGYGIELADKYCRIVAQRFAELYGPLYEW